MTSPTRPLATRATARAVALAKRSAGALALAVASTAVAVAPAHADHRPVFGADDSYYVWVDVVDVDPIRSVAYVDEPVERCYETRASRTRGHDRWQDDRRRDDARYADRRRGRADPGAVIVGGVLGGLVGNQFGGGNGKRALTVAGALLGASVAAEASRSSAPRQRSDRWREAPVRRCEIEYEQRRVERIDGYEVSYRYAGRRFTRVVDDHPGERMRVRVDLQPV